jgi:hypothetical protein
MVGVDPRHRHIAAHSVSRRPIAWSSPATTNRSREHQLPDVDPITVSVVQHRLHAIVEEMGEAMLRTS